MKRFSNKGGCGVCKPTCIKAFKRRAVLGYRLQVIGNKMLFKTVIPLLKNAVLNLKQCICCYVAPIY